MRVLWPQQLCCYSPVHLRIWHYQINFLKLDNDHADPAVLLISGMKTAPLLGNTREPDLSDVTPHIERELAMFGQLARF